MPGSPAYKEAPLDTEIARNLIREAQRMRSFSYAPYSRYTVGAALLVANGTIYTGCNIENIAFGPSNCAERTAFFKAVSEGIMQFTAIAIVGAPAGAQPADYCTPCGVCRQVMREFCADDFIVLMAKTEDDYKEMTLAQILPESFHPQQQVGAQGK